MKPATSNELRITIPTKLSQLTADQLQFLSALYLLQYAEAEFLTKALLKITGLKVVKEVKNEPGAYWFKHQSLKKPFIMDADQIAEAKKKVEFLLSPDEIHPLKWIGLTRARHFRLYNASFEEYLMAENYYFAYIETKKPEHLDNLISVLYRLPWHRWNAEKIQLRAARFRSVSPVIKQTVFLWYIGFRSFIPKRCPALFSGPPSKKAFNPRNYINGMIHQLSNGDITIKNKLLQQSCWDALDELEQRAIEADSINAK
jgi:hypothetical protein